MPQSYTLRLSDGTVLLVDHASLGSWLADRNALVRPAGSNHWTPVRDFLAQERTRARRAARLQPEPPSTSRDALPLVYPEQQPKPDPSVPLAPAAPAVANPQPLPPAPVVAPEPPVVALEPPVLSPEPPV